MSTSVIQPSRRSATGFGRALLALVAGAPRHVPPGQPLLDEILAATMVGP